MLFRSGAWQSLGRAAAKANVGLYANSSFRLGDSCGGDGDGRICAGNNKSLHQLGIAIDFNNMRVTGGDTCSTRAKAPSSPQWNWLYNNAFTWDIKQYATEAWHWDLSGLENRCNQY